MTGHYLALEGIEGAGKSSVAEGVAASLRAEGADVVAVREPGGTETGEGIRRLLLHGDEMEAWTEALLFAAQRAQLAAEVIRPALEAGTWVVGDRSVYSSMAYQGGGRNLGVERVRAVNEAGLGGTWPELVVLLNIPLGTGLGRQRVADRIGSQDDHFHRRVAATYRRLAAAEPGRFQVVDATRPLATVVAEVVEAVRSRW